MGKQVQKRNYYRFRLDNNHQQQQGRFWGMFHALDYHHWGCVKKLLHKKNVGKNRFRCCLAPRTVSFNFSNGEEYVDDDSEHLLHEHREGNKSPLNFSSSKKIHSEETSQELVISNPILVFHGAAHTRLIDERFNRPFNKARSFPAPKPDFLGAKLCRSSTMDHKQNEVWLFPKGEKRNTVTVDSPKGNKSVQIGKDSTSKHGWKINPFKIFKKKIKRVLQETRKEETKDISINKSNDIGINETKQTRITRLSSLTESIDKYIRLFEGSYGKEGSKLNHAKSLKLPAAEESKVNGQKSLRRGFSLPNYEARDSLLSEESQENLQPREENLRSGSLTTTYYKDSNCVEIVDEQESIEDDSRIDFVDDSFDGSETDIDLNAKSPSIRLRNEGECATIDDHSDEEGVVETTNVENVSKLIIDSTTSVATRFDNLIESRGDPVKEEDPNFKFVREILNSAGFIENELIPTWDSIHLPLNPTLYDEQDGTGDRELLFDLINEALLEIYQRSFTYFPVPFSFNPYTRPVTKGKHVVDEVWRVVKFYKDLKPELDVTIDNIVARDMARQDGWVNYGLDNEFVALELEELVLNELVDELLDVLH